MKRRAASSAVFAKKESMSMSKGTYSFTTPIYYVNAAPHLGTAYTTIAADAVARYQRMNGYDVAFVTGMDEHGQKVADTAAAKGMTPQDWCDSMEPAFRDCWDMLDITYTDFVRTTEPRHAETVKKFWQDLYDKGYCYKGSYEGWYCVHEETYYNESDLLKNDEGEFVCPDCKRPVQKAGGEENWFFKLSEFQEPLLKLYEENPDFIRPETRKNEIVSFVKSGLKDLSISRSTFDWGVPLPFDEGHVAYVWADALLAYFTGIGYGSEERAGEFEQRWPMQYHFVGKDITRFHCVIWPAMLMAAGLPVAHTVFGHGFLLTKGEKMSKSKGNALKPADLVKVFGVDAYRYYFLSDVQFGHDGSISIERMVQVYNADLANTWGNLCSRVFNMTKKYFEGKVPAAPAGAEENPLREIADELYAEYDKCMGQVDFTNAAAAVQKLASRVNLYVEDSAPWNLAKSEETADELAAVIYNALEAIRIIALYMAPFMPNTSAEVFNRLGLGDIFAITDIEAASVWGQLEAGSAVAVGDPLYPRLDADAIDLSIE
ncbi:MAG: methionine--tRNA ligase [Eggerthellaceae bacterium]|nr:methionine--tRNA ligase [Eggerthellaceae bacterium]MEE0826782.1 methionine--tRNA ligase [Eggerthellaceae bacterium]